VQHKHASVPAVGIAPSTFSTSPQIAASREMRPTLGDYTGWIAGKGGGKEHLRSLGIRSTRSERSSVRESVAKENRNAFVERRGREIRRRAILKIAI